MEDAEILKGLECCSQDGMCGECPTSQSLSPRCAEIMVARGVDLIKRLQEQIQIQEDKIKEARADAIKEFVERMKNESNIKWDWSESVDVEDIDQIVKEMVGESDDR